MDADSRKAVLSRIIRGRKKLKNLSVPEMRQPKLFGAPDAGRESTSDPTMTQDNLSIPYPQGILQGPFLRTASRAAVWTRLRIAAPRV
jgi:hypothetical protein